MIDVRFATTLQVMLSLALAHKEGVMRLNSIQLAHGTASHPSLIRRLLPLLTDAGLINSAMGRDGGVFLARPAREITLLDIYSAVVGEQALWQSRKDIPHRCVVSANMEAFFRKLSKEAEEAVMSTLRAKTLEASLYDLQAMNKSDVPVIARP